MGIRTALSQFLEGRDENVAEYNPRNWDALPNTDIKYPIDRVLSFLVNPLIQRAVVDGRPWSGLDRSNIPNVLAFIEHPQLNLTAKLGSTDSIRNTAEALSYLQHAPVFHKRLQAVNPGAFQSRLHPHIGMLIRDYIEGEVMTPADWDSHRQELRSYVEMKLHMWAQGYSQAFRPGQHGQAPIFVDCISEGNIIKDPSGFIFFIDADMMHVMGKHKPGEYFSGDIVAGIRAELATLGINLSELGFSWSRANDRIDL